jgi:hypothetical protein
MVGYSCADTAPTKPVVRIPTREQQEASQNASAEEVSQLSRRARTQQLAQNQAQIKRADLNQLPLQDIVSSA